MAERFSRHLGDGVYEHFDSQEELAAAVRREHSSLRGFLFGCLGLVAGGVLAYWALQQAGLDLPKWLRFGLVIAGSVTLATVLAKLADLIWNLLLIAIGLAVLSSVGAMIWNAV